jgi:hypothetical protein
MLLYELPNNILSQFYKFRGGGKAAQTSFLYASRGSGSLIMGTGVLML